MAHGDRAEASLKAAEEVATLLREVNRGLRRRMEACDTAGLTIPQAVTMRIAAHNPGLTLTELSQKMGLANSTVSGIVDRLEREGLLLRTPDPADRRVFRVNPTPAAEVRRERYASAVRAALTGVLGRLSPEELSSLRAALAALARALGPEESPS